MKSSAEEAKELLIRHLRVTGDSAIEVGKIVDLIIEAAASEASAQIDPGKPRVKVSRTK